KFAKEWQNTPLELELYGTRSRAWRFFENAAEARSLENSDALEVFALCVANGFEGVYRSDAFDPETFVSAGPSQADLRELGATASGSASAVAEGGTAVETKAEVPDRTHQQRLPATLDEWASSIFQQLLEDRLKPFHTTSPYDSVRTAQPLTSSQAVVRWGLMLGVAVLVTLWLLVMWGA
ncbi:MAG: DotU family type IV/VI secretion system protein, partial [Planctomycetaceae bacterium]